MKLKPTTFNSMEVLMFRNRELWTLFIFMKL